MTTHSRFARKLALGALVGKGELDRRFHEVFRQLLLTAAWQESCWRQFAVKDAKRVPLKSGSGDIGLMQINERVWRGLYDLQGLRWDMVYNARAGTDILENYAQIVEEKDPRTGRKKTKQIWPRYHQLGVVRQALADVAGLDERPGTYHAGYVLGPRINAGGRIGQSDLGARLLSTDDEIVAREIAERLDALNRERQDTEARVLEEAMAQAEAEKAAIVNALKQTGNNKAQAASLLGIHRTLLYKKMTKYAIPLKPNA